MKLEQLHHLLAIVDSGSLRAASRRLEVPQPALTRSIRSLERELHAVLFLRETTGMVLTPLGRRFHARASAIVNEERRARDEIAQESGDESGTVVAALSIMPHVGMLPHSLQSFRERWPKVKLQLIEGLFPDAEGGLRDGSIDFYLGASPREAPAPGLHTQHLFDNARAVVCRQGHPLARSRSLKGLAGADWAITATDYNAEQDLSELFASHGIAHPNIQLRASSAMSIMVALAYTDLMAMLPVQWADFPLTREALQIVKIREFLPAPSIVLVTKTGLPPTPAAEFLCDVLLRHQPVGASRARMSRAGVPADA